MDETKITIDQVSGLREALSGSATTTYEPAIPSMRDSDEYSFSVWLHSYVPNQSLKIRTNSEYYISFMPSIEERDTGANCSFLEIGGILRLRYVVQDPMVGVSGLFSYNYETDTEDHVMSQTPISSGDLRVPGVSDFYGRVLDLKCVVNYPTKSWYYRNNGVWTLLAYGIEKDPQTEADSAVPSVFTDNAMTETPGEPSEGAPDYRLDVLCNNVHLDNRSQCPVFFKRLRIMKDVSGGNPGTVVFDGATAPSGSFECMHYDGEIGGQTHFGRPLGLIMVFGL